jgi:hypothetical protein
LNVKQLMGICLVGLFLVVFENCIYLMVTKP